jgi:glycosyltransferase involved in cell wall biosynthesis
MDNSSATPKGYLIVSPVKDEQQHVERTLRSVVQQTVLPVQWIIVDDGSTDGTAEILKRYEQTHSWIRVVTRIPGAPRRPGSAVMHAFYEGLDRAGALSYGYLVKLDCDVELPADYFERLLARFESDPRLGIASGVYQEAGPDGWSVVDMPAYHAAGASKVVRTRCFDDIGGFVRERGWDTVDELRAHVKGWTTTHFPDLRFLHLKPEGSGIGSMRTHTMHGDVYYLTGGGVVFLLAKAAHRMVTGSPPILGGLAMLFGYVRSWATRQRLVDRVEARHYRRLLNRRLMRLPKFGSGINAAESR